MYISNLQRLVNTFHLQIKAATSFESDSVLEKFDDVWEALKKELLPGPGDKEVHDTALFVITAIVRKFHDDQPNSDIVLNKIFTTTIGTLLNRDSKLYEPTMKVVLQCAEATDSSCVYVMNKVLPISLTDLTSNDDITIYEKSQVLEDLRNFLAIASEKNLLNGYSGENYVLHIQKELMKVLMTPNSSELLKTTWLVLKSMSCIVTDENRQILYKKLNVELTRLLSEQVECLLALAKDYPNEVYELVLASHIKRSFDDPVEAKNIFTALAELLEVPELKDHIIELLCLNVFNNSSSAIQLVVLEVLNSILSKAKTPDIAKFLNDEWRIVVKLIDLIKNKSPNDPEDVMYQAALLMNLVVKTLPNDQQMALVEKYLPLMNLSHSIPDLYATSGLLGFLDAAVPLETHFEQLTKELVTLSLNSNDERSRKLANQLLCSLFNRAPIDDKHRKLLSKLYDFLKDEIKKHNHHAVEILGWISKGLLARGHPDAADILETIAELLDHPKLSKAAELAFEIISIEFPLLHLPLLKHLFRQKVFVLSMKFLEDKIEHLGEHHLTAIAHVLNITPLSVLKMNMEKVGPILVKCIQVESEDGKPHGKRILISLKIMNDFILDKSQYMLDHLQHLVRDFLKLTQFKSAMEVRITACTCLKNLTEFPLFTLVPYKNEVILDLAAALDDPKRLVRAAAVSARMAWYLIGENDDGKVSK